MAFIGGVVGVLLGLSLVAIPPGIELALWLGVSVVFPPFAPLFAAPLAVILIVHAVVVWIAYLVASSRSRCRPPVAARPLPPRWNCSVEGFSSG